jgi:hypothetical protein
MNDTVSLVRMGERFALFGEGPDAWIRADPSVFVELDQ